MCPHRFEAEGIFRRRNGPRRALLKASVGVRIVTNSLGRSWRWLQAIFLKGITPLGTITHKNCNLAGPRRGKVAGYFCHREGRSDTQRAPLASLRPIAQAAMPFGLGISPTPKGGSRSGDSVLVALQQWNNEMAWCETIDCEARNMIKSDEHRFATSCVGCHTAFALKGKDFS